MQLRCLQKCGTVKHVDLSLWLPLYDGGHTTKVKLLIERPLPSAGRRMKSSMTVPQRAKQPWVIRC